jgi:hypothetical protein
VSHVDLELLASLGALPSVIISRKEVVNPFLQQGDRHRRRLRVGRRLRGRPLDGVVRGVKEVAGLVRGLVESLNYCMVRVGVEYCTNNNRNGNTLEFQGFRMNVNGFDLCCNSLKKSPRLKFLPAAHLA